MKHLFYIFSLIAMAGCLASCSKDNDEGWLYGEKQELVGTTWHEVKSKFAGDRGLPNSHLSTETLSFEANSFDMTVTSGDYTATTHGSYEYKHPKLMLTLEDDSEIEAWISALNTIKFYGTDGYLKEFKRE